MSVSLMPGLLPSPTPIRTAFSQPGPRGAEVRGRWGNMTSAADLRLLTFAHRAARQCHLRPVEARLARSDDRNDIEDRLSAQGGSHSVRNKLRLVLPPIPTLLPPARPPMNPSKSSPLKPPPVSTPISLGGRLAWLEMMRVTRRWLITRAHHGVTTGGIGHHTERVEALLPRLT